MKSAGLRVAFAMALLAPPVAGAQDRPDEARVHTPTPPVLLQFMPAVLPSDVVIGSAGIEVLLDLTIDDAGRVTDVTPDAADPVDPRILESVVAAARQLAFAPATRRDVAIAARIHFLYRIEATPPPEPIVEPPPAEPAVTTAAADSNYQATARTRIPPREVTRRELTASQVGRIAGTRGDTLRAIEILPGVARPPLNDGQVIVRGSSPQDTQVLVDGTPVLFLYHLGGLTSFFNASLLSRVDFYPGNFSARFGRAMGGVIDVEVRSPRQDHAHTTIDLNLIDASLLVEAPISDSAGFAIAARRSYIDLFFDAVVPESSTKVIAAPRYWDYQAVGEVRLSQRDRLRMQSFGSRDEMRLVNNTPDETNVDLRGKLGFSSEFHRALLSWSHDYGGGLRHETMIGVGTLSIDADIGELLSQRIRAPTFFSRAEWHVPVIDTLTLDTGWDFVGYRGRVIYEGPSFFSGGNEVANQVPMHASLDQVATILRPAGFAELGWLPHPRLRVIPGVRVDYTSEVQDVTVDPRLVTRWSVTDDTILKAGVGRFSQPPELGSAFPSLGNPKVQSSASLHTSVGIEQRVGDDLQLGAETYGKLLWDLPVSDPSGGPSPINDGRGRILGVEFSARYQHGRTFGYLAYTLSRSERSIRGGPFRLHDYDQPHILNVSAGYDLGRSWDVSGTFRLVSGNPETPVVGALYDADRDEHLPVYGAVNSARAALFHRLDLRIQKRWQLGYARLSLYLDLINAYNSQVNEATDYNFDYRQRSAVSGLPLLPVLGVRGEI